LISGGYLDLVRPHGDGLSGQVIAEPPEVTGHIAQCRTGLDPLTLGAASLAPRPFVKVRKGIAHVLDPGQCFLELLACPGEFGSDARVDP
jgi:hypothetical protein